MRIVAWKCVLFGSRGGFSPGYFITRALLGIFREVSKGCEHSTPSYVYVP